MSRSRRLRGLAATALAAMLTLAAPPASAGPKEKAEARALVAKAKNAAKQKRWAEAAEALEQADQLDPSPQTKLDLARALVPQGKLVAASKALNAAVSSATSPSSKPVAKAAKKLLEEIEQKIPWVQIDVIGPAPDQAITTIDGQEVEATTEVPFDPGDHLVAAEADGFERAEKRIELTEGEHEKVTLRLERIVVAAAPAPAATDEGGGSAVPAAIAFALGAAGIGIGTVFGIMAFNETSKVESQCNGTRCPPDVRDALDVAKANGTVSTIGFIVGGVGVAAGVVLLLTSGDGDSPSKEDMGASEQVSVRPYVGPGHVGLTGAF